MWGFFTHLTINKYSLSTYRISDNCVNLGHKNFSVVYLFKFWLPRILFKVSKVSWFCSEKCCLWICIGGRCKFVLLTMWLRRARKSGAGMQSLEPGTNSILTWVTEWNAEVILVPNHCSIVVMMTWMFLSWTSEQYRAWPSHLSILWIYQPHPHIILIHFLMFKLGRIFQRKGLSPDLVMTPASPKW